MTFTVVRYFSVISVLFQLFLLFERIIKIVHRVISIYVTIFAFQILSSYFNGFSEEKVNYVCSSHLLQIDVFIFKGAHIQSTPFPHKSFGKR